MPPETAVRGGERPLESAGRKWSKVFSADTRNFHKNQAVKFQNLRSKMLKKDAKIFGYSEKSCTFVTPKLEQNAPNQLSFNKLGENKETLKHLENVTA